MFFLIGVILGFIIGAITVSMIAKIKITKIEERHRDCWEAHINLNNKDGH